ncbi:MAG: Holliday junction resolvase RuvX [Oscillospiraceae bacterium]|nr:Holliday junction resolvase RuvX [Oscillospiraceae bacterium]
MKILAIDYGDARTGLAISDSLEILASPFGVLHEKNSDRLIGKIKAVIEENGVEEAVVGNPVNMNNTEGERSRKCVFFAEKLRQSVEIPVVLWDERSTTILAHNLLSQADVKSKKRREIIDAAAAAVILENYLVFRKNNSEKL